MILIILTIASFFGMVLALNEAIKIEKKKQEIEFLNGLPKFCVNKTEKYHGEFWK